MSEPNVRESDDDKLNKIETDQNHGVVTVRYEDDAAIYVRSSRTGGDSVVMARHVGSVLHLYPTQGIDRGSEAAYGTLREIRLEGFSEVNIARGVDGTEYIAGLPRGLGSSFRYGLTFPRNFKFIPGVIEARSGCEVLHLKEGGGVSITDNVLSLSYDRFDGMVREAERTRNRASDIVSKINKVLAQNLLAEAVNGTQIEPTRGRVPAIQKLTDVITGSARLSEDEEVDVIRLLADQVDGAVQRHPAAIGRLRRDLDHATLDALIRELDAALNKKGKEDRESFWQKFFEDNAFALQQLFGVPVARIAKEQLQVRPAKSNGRGAIIVDFLLANSLTQEGVVVEIKTPATRLVDSASYRGRESSAVYRPHPDLAGAVAQLQAQKDALRDRLSARLDHDDPMSGLQGASPKGAIIIGRVRDLKPDQLASFRRYRDGLHDVVVIGFDEAVERLRVLRDLLEGGNG